MKMVDHSGAQKQQLVAAGCAWIREEVFTWLLAAAWNGIAGPKAE
jgi:hypothetical protein